MRFLKMDKISRSTGCVAFSYQIYFYTLKVQTHKTNTENFSYQNDINHFEGDLDNGEKVTRRPKLVDFWGRG